MLLFLDFSLLFSLPPEGLKKVRNPDRMYRSAVCYAGHGPPKSMSDDTEMKSKSQLLILHCCCERPLAGRSIIHSLIHLFTSWFHQYPCLPPPTAPCSPPPPHTLTSPFAPFIPLQHQHLLCLLCWLKYLLYWIKLSIAKVLLLTKSDCFRLRPGDQNLSGPLRGRANTRRHQLWSCSSLFVSFFFFRPAFAGKLKQTKKKNEPRRGL